MSVIINPQIRRSEKGMIAITTALVLMVVISLIVLGFAQISRRNQRETLDRQLSTQAFYAAETGVNDARERINTAVASGLKVEAKNECDGTGVAGFYTGLNPDIDSALGVKYSCLLVDPEPKTLQYSNIGVTTTVVPVISADSSPLSKVDLKWQSKSGSATPLSGCPGGTSNVFSPAASWSCGYGILRIDFVPTSGGLTSDSLTLNTMTIFAVPVSSGSTVNNVSYPANINTANSNVRIGASCTNAGCELQISGLSQNSYHMRVSSIYKDASLQVSAGGASGSQRLTGAQAVIDSTGRAQDVLRRIQVNIPLRASSKNELSDYAIEMNGSMCKRYSVASGYISNSVPGAPIAGGGRLCQSF